MASPTTVLNSPADTATKLGAAPVFNFTGTDTDGDTIEYEVQVDTSNTFNSDTYGWSPIIQSISEWRGAAVDEKNSTVYAARESTNYGKQTNGIGALNALNPGIGTITNIFCNPVNHDVFAIVLTTPRSVWKQTGGTGSFVDMGVTGRTYWSLAIDTSNGDIFATVITGTTDIYKMTGGIGDFIAVGSGIGTTTSYGCAVDSSNHDVFYSNSDATTGQVYKQTAGTGSFVSMGQTARYYICLSVDSTTHDLYTGIDNGGDVYKMTGGTGNFVAMHAPGNIGWLGVSVDSSNHNVYAASPGNGVYKLQGSILDKRSNVPDTGFSAGHPYTSGVAQTFMPQPADALAHEKTYYWRVRGIDLLGSGEYGAWATTRSFTTGFLSNEPFNIYRSQGFQ